MEKVCTIGQRLRVSGGPLCLRFASEEAVRIDAGSDGRVGDGGECDEERHNLQRGFEKFEFLAMNWESRCAPAPLAAERKQSLCNTKGGSGATQEGACGVLGCICMHHALRTTAVLSGNWRTLPHHH